MSIPDFERAEYIDPVPPPPPFTGALPPSPYAAPNAPSIRALTYAEPVAVTSNFVKSIAFGCVAALVGTLGYGLVGLSRWTLGIVAIGVGFIVARAMMTASLGVGGRKYQVVAAILTYLACSTGQLLDVFWFSRADLGHHTIVYLVIFAVGSILAGPFFALAHPLNGLVGLFILFVGLRAAWRMAAGGPGFGNRTTPFG